MRLQRFITRKTARTRIHSMWCFWRGCWGDCFSWNCYYITMYPLPMTPSTPPNAIYTNTPIILNRAVVTCIYTNNTYSICARSNGFRRYGVIVRVKTQRPPSSWPACCGDKNYYVLIFYKIQMNSTFDLTTIVVLPLGRIDKHINNNLFDQSTTYIK